MSRLFVKSSDASFCCHSCLKSFFYNRFHDRCVRLKWKFSLGSLFRSNKYQMMECNLPGPFDVVCGKGPQCWFHSGNKFLRRLLLLNIDDYQAANTKAEKSYILHAIVQRVGSNGGRFLKKRNRPFPHYVVCGLKAAR